MLMVEIKIKPLEKEISIEMPKEILGKITEEEYDDINSRVFSIAFILNDIAKR